MKKIFLFCSFIFLLNSKSHAQLYHSFPDSNASWSENFHKYMAHSGGYMSIERNGWNYALGNDTIINSIKYIMLKYRHNYHYLLGNNNSVSWVWNDTMSSQIFGAIREDSSKRIWFRNFLSTHNGFPTYCQQWPDYCFSLDSFPVDSDLLLYDFNLQIGDTIPWAPNGLGRKVILIDSIMLNDNSFRKRIGIFSNPAAIEYWIEGIGAEQGLFGAYMPPYIIGFPMQQPLLACFKQNGQLLYDTSDASNEYECDTTFVHVSPEPEDSDTVVLNAFIYYSHPEKKLFFHLKDDFFLDDELKIYNCIGQLIYKITITSEIFQINFSTETTGIYFYQINDNESSQLHSGKFLVE